LFHDAGSKSRTLARPEFAVSRASSGHSNSPDELITLVRNWLRGASKRANVPGPRKIKERFARFSTVIPAYCDRLGLERTDIQFAEYVTMVEEWLRSAR
jgi:hypothetical protein